jgi:hypothetical protein
MIQRIYAIGDKDGRLLKSVAGEYHRMYDTRKGANKKLAEFKSQGVSLHYGRAEVKMTDLRVIKIS